MGLIDKKAADWTARDVVNVWTLTGILDVFKCLSAFSFFFRSRPKRTERDIRQAQIDSERQYYLFKK